MALEYARRTPESAGIPSGEILAYLTELRDARLCLHDVLLFRDGALLYEGYWKPMDRRFPHRHYSCSKSFVSVAIGAAIGEGLLTLDDRCIDFFPDKAPQEPHPWLAAVTIRDMLRMSTCFTQGAYYSPQAPDWADTWFSAPPSHMPGKVFSYDTAGTTMLCMILRRVTGMEFLDYLRLRVLDRIGFDPEHRAWCVETPCGHQWGGSGIVCTGYDFARFAMFCMNYGCWEGEQLVPEWYMREATSKRIALQTTGSSYNNNGYGYQFWTLPDGGFSFNGMGCQFAICLPKQKLLLITHGYEELEPAKKSMIFGGFARHIAGHNPDPIPVIQEETRALAAFTDALYMVTPDGALENTQAAARYSGRVFRFPENELGWKWASCDFTPEGGVLRYENAGGCRSLAFRYGTQAEQPFPEDGYYDRRIGTPGGFGYPCHTSAAWAERVTDGGENDVLVIWCQITGSHLAQLRMTCAFTPEGLTLMMSNHAEWFLQGYSGFASGV